MALTRDQIEKAVARYEREYDRYNKLADLVYERCQDLLHRSELRATVQRRAKAPESLRLKLVSFMQDPRQAPRFSRVDDVFRLVSDLAGVRVTTYVESDRQRVVHLLFQEFAGPHGENAPELDIKDGRSRSPHYRATHCQVRIVDDRLPPTCWNLKGATCEVQVSSLLAHVYNEIEHDLRYKQLGGTLPPEVMEVLDEVARLTEEGDRAIRRLLDLTSSPSSRGYQS